MNFRVLTSHLVGSFLQRRVPQVLFRMITSGLFIVEQLPFPQYMAIRQPRT